MKQETFTYRSLTIILALSISVLGLFSLIRTFTQGHTFLLTSQDQQITKATLSVDNNVRGHLNWYCSDLKYITGGDGFLRAEALWRETGNSLPLLTHLQENPLMQTGFIDSILVEAGNQGVLTTGKYTDYEVLAHLGTIQGVNIYLYKDPRDTIYVALCQRNASLSYTALIDGNVFFTIAETQTAADESDLIQLLDASGQYFFHRTAQGIRIDEVKNLDINEYPSLQLLQRAQSDKNRQTDSFHTGKDENYTARMVALPDALNSNSCFTVGLVHNYTQSTRPFRTMTLQVVISSSVIVAGIALLVISLIRFQRSHQKIREELVLLHEKADAMEQLNHQTQELMHHQRLETIGTLTSSIVHEFNNLLTPIMGYSILVLERLPPEDQDSYDNMLEIYAASRKAKEIISRLSDLSRKNPISSFTDIVPNDLVRQVLTVAAPAKPINVTIQTELQYQNVFFRGNETQLSQMLLNLIINAFQAMERHGGTLTVSTAFEDNTILFRVHDNGTGISPDILDKLFDPFFTTKETGKGTGLGLAIVRQIVDSHNGSIEVSSTLGEGTCFTVRFPITEPLDPPSP